MSTHRVRGGAGASGERAGTVGDTIGLLFDDQEAALARAISDAFELDLT